MSKLTREYILRVINDGIQRYGGIQADYEKAVGLNKQAIKDIRRAKKCPPADIWEMIKEEAKIGDSRYSAPQDEGVLSAIEVLIAAIARNGAAAVELETLFTHQKRVFGKNSQSDEAELMERFLKFLRSGLPQRAAPATRKSSPRATNQSRQQINQKNQPY